MALTKVPQTLHEDSSISTPQLADGALSADATGRAKMADGFSTTAKLADGALSADTPGRAKMADGFVNQAKMGAGVAGTGPAFSAYRATSSQTVTSGVATKVQLNAEDFDTAAAFDPTTNYRFQPAVAGYYMITGRAACNASSGGTVASLQLYKNGALLQYGQPYIPPSGSSSMTVTLTGLVYLNGSTDYLELWTTLAGSGTVTVQTGTGQTIMQRVHVPAG